MKVRRRARCEMLDSERVWRLGSEDKNASRYLRTATRREGRKGPSRASDWGARSVGLCQALSDPRILKSAGRTGSDAGRAIRLRPKMAKMRPGKALGIKGRRASLGFVGPKSLKKYESRSQGCGAARAIWANGCEPHWPPIGIPNSASGFGGRIPKVFPNDSKRFQAFPMISNRFQLL